MRSYGGCEVRRLRGRTEVVRYGGCAVVRRL